MIQITESKYESEYWEEDGSLYYYGLRELLTNIYKEYFPNSCVNIWEESTGLIHIVPSLSKSPDEVLYGDIRNDILSIQLRLRIFEDCGNGDLQGIRDINSETLIRPSYILELEDCFYNVIVKSRDIFDDIEYYKHLDVEGDIDTVLDAWDDYCKQLYKDLRKYLRRGYLDSERLALLGDAEDKL